MNKKILLKLITMLLGVLICTTTICFAYTPNEFNDKINMSPPGSEDIKDVGGKIVGIIQIVGTIISVAMLIVLGIKYMIGSAEERAEYKRTLLPYIIGAIMLFAAVNLTDVIYGLVNPS